MLNFKFPKQPYIAIIGDIVNSKQLKQRADIQETLRVILEQCNTVFAAQISSKFMITLGDEFQGLLHDGSVILAIIEKIETALYPVQLRFAIGVGAITTEINPDLPLGADGPAYYNARAVINAFKDKENKKMTAKANISIKTEAVNNIDDLINALFNQIYLNKNSWTARQREIILRYQQNQENQSTLAAQLKINQSSVQRALHKAGYYTYKQSLDTINSYFRMMGVDTDV